MKTCPRCKVCKPASEFSKCSKRYDGLQGECKVCCSVRRKAFGATEEGKTYFREAQREYNATTKGRAYKLWRSATKRHKVVTITPEWVAEKLSSGKCSMTGLTLRMEHWRDAGDRHPRSPSLDRIDPKKGYTPDNVRIVCWQVNLARNSYGDEALYEMCRAISSQASSKEVEGSETIPSGSTPKRAEAPSPQPG